MTHQRSTHGMRRRAIGAGLSVLAALAIAACGGGSAGNDKPAAPPSTTTPTSLNPVTPAGAGAP